MRVIEKKGEREKTKGKGNGADKRKRGKRPTKRERGI